MLTYFSLAFLILQNFDLNQTFKFSAASEHPGLIQVWKPAVGKGSPSLCCDFLCSFFCLISFSACCWAAACSLRFLPDIRAAVVWGCCPLGVRHPNAGFPFWGVFVALGRPVTKGVSGTACCLVPRLGAHLPADQCGSPICFWTPFAWAYCWNTLQVESFQGAFRIVVLCDVYPLWR